MKKLNTGELGKNESAKKALTPKEAIFNEVAEATDKGKVVPIVPIIGKHYVDFLAFEKQIDKEAVLDLVEVYGSEIEHPAFKEEDEAEKHGAAGESGPPRYKSGYTITGLAQYRSVKLASEVANAVEPEKMPGETVKREYLAYLKKVMFHFVNEGLVEISPEKMAELVFNERKLDFSQLCTFLDWPRLDDDHPLMLLAKLNIAVFITTSHHALLERALQEAGKEPVVEICRWREDLNLPTVFGPGATYVPDPKRPLVFHLHGLDSVPASLVLTEDDHLDLLTNIEGMLPAQVTAALESSSLVVMGYHLHDWDFKVLFRGIVRLHRKRPLASVAIQLEEHEEDEEYLKLYLEQLKNFEVEWDSDPGSFIKEMSERSEKP